MMTSGNRSTEGYPLQARAENVAVAGERRCGGRSPATEKGEAGPGVS